MGKEETIIHLIRDSIEQIHKRFDVLDAKNDQRDMSQNAMHAANTKRIDDLEKRVDKATTVWATIATMGTMAAGFVGWLLNSIPHVFPSVWAIFTRAT